MVSSGRSLPRHGGKITRQAVGPAGDRPGAKAHHHIAGLRQFGDDGRQVARFAEGTHIAMAVLGQPGDDRIAADTFDRILASGVDIGDEDNVGIVEAGAKIIEQVRDPAE